MLVVIPLGTALGLLLSRSRFPGKRALETLLMLPLVLPPTVTGFYLLYLLGSEGPIGSGWEAVTGTPIAFTWLAAVAAASVVALPIMVRAASSALGSVEPRFEEASLCLGKGPLTTFFRVTLPLARRGILAGAVLAFARALGEFGATLMLAGNIPGRTQTMPLAIYEAVASGDDIRAHVLAVLLTAVSVVVVVLAARLEPQR